VKNLRLGMHIVENQTVRNQVIVFDPFPLLGTIVRSDNTLLTEEEPLHKPIEGLTFIRRGLNRLPQLTIA
jgi:hypothetical protein